MRRWFPDDEIRILATPTEFVFRDSAMEITLPTVAWVDSDARIIVFEEPGPGAPPLTRVDIFKPAPTDPIVSRGEMLEKLMRHGLVKLITETVFKVKPLVRFGPLQCFDPILSGFQRELFEHAARGAGASVVEFEA